MPDKITLRTINTSTYPHAGMLEIDNITHGLRIIMDERDSADDSMIKERFDAISTSMEEALADERVAADAKVIYAALRRFTLVKLQDYVDAKNQPKPVDPDESGVTIDAKENRDEQ